MRRVALALCLCACSAKAPVKASGGWEIAWTKAYGDGEEQAITDAAMDPEGNLVVVGYFAGTIDFGEVELVASANDTDFFVAKIAPDGTTRWARRFGSPRGSDYVTAVSVGKDGRIWMAGTIQEPVDFGAGLEGVEDVVGSEGFLLGLTEEGNRFDARVFFDVAGRFGVGLEAVATGEPGVVFAGGRGRQAVDLGGGARPCRGFSALIARFDAGRHVWSRCLEGDAEVNLIRILPQGLAICGWSNGPIAVTDPPLATANEKGVFTALLNPSTGATKWAVGGQGAGLGLRADVCTDIISLPGRGIAVIGGTPNGDFTVYSSEGDELERKRAGGAMVGQAGATEILVAGRERRAGRRRAE
jgi:hypothetical protein